MGNGTGVCRRSTDKLKAIRDRAIMAAALAVLLLDAASIQAQNSNPSPLVRAGLSALTNTPEAFLDANKRGLTFYAQGKFPEAEHEFQTAWAIGEKILSPENPNLAVVALNLTDVFFEQKKFPEAEAAARHLLQLQEKNPLPHDTNVLQVRQLFAVALEKNSKFDEAVQEFSTLVAANSEIYGPESKQTLAIRNLQAVNLYTAGKYAEAAEEFATILPVQERVLGKDDPATVQTRANLARSQVNVKHIPAEMERPLNTISIISQGLLGALMVAFGIPLSLVLNRRLRARFPEARPFRWGYFCALVGTVYGGCNLLGWFILLLGQVVTPLLALFGVTLYTILSIAGAYTFLRKRWALIVGSLLTGFIIGSLLHWTLMAEILSGIWVLGHAVYIARRWREMAKGEQGRPLDLFTSVAARLPAPAGKPPADWRERLTLVLRDPQVHEPDAKLSEAPKRGFLNSVKRIILLTLVLVVLIVTCMSVLVVAVTRYHLPEVSVTVFCVILGVAGSAAVMVAQFKGQKARLRGIQRKLGYSAIEQVARAKTAPVLYLRAFNFDSRATEIPLWQRALGMFVIWSPISTPELGLAAMLRHRKVPMLAIGRPGEKEPPAGAARVYVEESHWQDFVKETVPLTSFVIWATGYTAGLRWELEHLVTNVSPRRLVLWPHVGLGRWSEKEQRADWARFLERFQGVFPKPLPENVSGIEYIAFEDDWTPRYFPNPRQQFSIWERLKLLPPRLFLRDFLDETLE
jgi:tetratricopeptide (TPR) repeat protein